jgi:RNA polymerase primary sigma factor
MIEMYLKELKKSIPLSQREEIELAKAAKEGSVEARNKLVTANLRYALHLAKKYNNNNLPLEHLISAANVGLMTAADRFDPTFGVKFITYARTWIQEAIMRELNERHLIHTPPKREQVYTSSIDQAVPGTDDLYLYETIAYDGARADTDTHKASFKEQLHKMLDSYPVRTREILDGYFHLYNDYTSLEEIGKKYNLTGERMRAIKNNTLRDLKEEFELEFSH